MQKDERRPYRAPRWSARTRWLLGLLAALPIIIGSAYVGTYYLLYRLLPWQKSDGMASTIFAAAAARGAAPHNGLAHGHMDKGTIRSTLLPGDHRFLAYLPPHYDPQHQRYPVLYLLHGAPGWYNDWYHAGGIDQTLDALIDTGRLRPMIAVLPDGNGGPWSDTEWANNGDGRLRVEDYMTQEVVPYIDAHYPTLADAAHRAIGGLSTGAFGAVNMTFHHPDVFGYALGLSGNYMAVKTWTGQTIWSDQAAKDFNSPIKYAPHAPNLGTVHVYLAVPPSDNDADTYHQTQRLDAVLIKLQVPHKADYFTGGHDWTYWKTHIVDGLEYVQQVMPAAP